MHVHVRLPCMSARHSPPSLPFFSFLSFTRQRGGRFKVTNLVTTQLTTCLALPCLALAGRSYHAQPAARGRKPIDSLHLLRTRRPPRLYLNINSSGRPRSLENDGDASSSVRAAALPCPALPCLAPPPEQHSTAPGAHPLAPQQPPPFSHSEDAHAPVHVWRQVTGHRKKEEKNSGAECARGCECRARHHPHRHLL